MDLNEETLLNLCIGSCISSDNNNSKEERLGNIELLNLLKTKTTKPEILEVIETGIGILEKEIEGEF